MNRPPKSTDPDAIKKGVSLTFAAGRIIRDLLDNGKFGPHFVVRVIHAKNMATGHHYELSIEPEARPDDAQYMSERVKIVVDREKVEFLRGTVIDYEEQQGQEGFRFLNPNEQEEAS